MRQIFVPTKKRAFRKLSPAIDKLYETGCSPTIVIEKEESKAYKKEYPFVKQLILPESGHSIGYSRQFILDYNREIGNPWYWQVDDNVLGFYEVRNRRNVSVFPEVLFSGIEEFVSENPGVLLAGAEHSQYAWANPNDYTLNRGVFCCVLTNSTTKINYDTTLQPREWCRSLFS